MYCYNCGKEISDKAVVCISCGVAVVNKETLAKAPTQLAKSTKIKPKVAEILLTVLPIVAIFLSILAIIMPITEFPISMSIGFTKYPDLHPGYMPYNAWINFNLYSSTIIFTMVASVLSAIVSGIATAISFKVKEKDKFKSFLAVAFAVAAIIYMISLSQF